MVLVLLSTFSTFNHFAMMGMFNCYLSEKGAILNFDKVHFFQGQ